MFAQLAAELLAAHRVLILTHLRPDGDALGSTFGMREFLRDNGIAAEVLIPGGMPDRYLPLCPDPLRSVSAADLEQYDLIITQDCANPERCHSISILPGRGGPRAAARYCSGSGASTIGTSC